MHKPKAAIVAFATLSVLTPGAALAASAKNYCISGFPDPSYKLVGIDFKVPGQGKCAAFNGFNPETANWPTSGTACTSSDGTTLSFTLTTSGVSAPFFEIDAVTLSLPDQTGEVAGQTITANAVSSFGPASGIVGGACTTSEIPSGGAESAVLNRRCRTMPLHRDVSQ
jgi:hypothetical protein